MTEEVPNDPIYEQLAPFLASNPDAKYERRGTQRIIARPWGDPTLELRIGHDADKLIAALNAIYLPPRFTALWHRDSKDLELIWTAVPVGPELRSRSFEFRYRDDSFRCEFGDASDRLLLVVDAARLVAPPTHTLHRNLDHFQVYLHMTREHPDIALPGAPTSFWIRNIEWDENRVVELARHLNFYMRYFDRETPHILIHEEPPTELRRAPEVQHPFGSFPSLVAGRALDPYLLGLWESAVYADPFRRFLYNYQILEYEAFYYLQEDISQTVRRIIASPDTPARLNEAVRKIVDAVVEGRLDDEAKIRAVVKGLVDPALLWKEIEPNLDFFCCDVQFDSGFSLPALLKPGWGLDDFKSVWIPKFPDALRKLRNALVHAREARMVRSIAPTRANYDRLLPWSALLSVTAMQVMLYREP